MKQFKVLVIQVQSGYFLIEAESEQEARKKFENGNYQHELQNRGFLPLVLVEVDE